MVYNSSDRHGESFTLKLLFFCTPDCVSPWNFFLRGRSVSLPRKFAYGRLVIIITGRFYIALFPALEQTHCARTWFCMSEYLFIARFWISTEVVYLQCWHGWCHMTLLPSRRILCTPYNHAPCHFMQSHIRTVYACLAVTCHMHFWQNHWDLLCATVVTRGWNGYQNKSQHRMLTVEKKNLLPLLQGFEPVTFRSRVWRSNHWAIPSMIMGLEHTAFVSYSDLMTPD